MNLKILFAGTPGAGKTTAISALSDVPAMTTEEVNNDATIDKAHTTVGMDYGVLSFDGGQRVHLFGAPGQRRFDFMWPILARDAMGIVLLIDNSCPDPIDDLRCYLRHFDSALTRASCVGGSDGCPRTPRPGSTPSPTCLRSTATPFRCWTWMCAFAKTCSPFWKPSSPRPKQAPSICIAPSNDMNLPTSPLGANAQRIAKHLLDSIDGSKAVVVASSDGFALGHAAREAVDASRIAALVSSLGALGSTASREMRIGNTCCLLVECSSGRLVIRSVAVDGNSLAIAVLADNSVTAGMVWAQLGRVEHLLAEH